jgi:outer membrane protein assembly factor BamB
MTWRKIVGVATVIALAAVSQAQVGFWPMERQNRWGDGRAPTSPPVSSLINGYVDTVIDSHIVSHGPSLGPSNIGYFGNWVDNKVFKFNYVACAILNSFGPAGAFITSTPAIYNQSLVVFETSSADTTAINTSTGAIVWTHNTGLSGSSPIIGPDGDIVAGVGGGTVYRWDALSGAEVWHKSGLGAIYRTPVFSRDDKFVFVANGNSITALNYSDGTVAWSKDMGYTVGAPGVASTGQLIFGSDQGRIFVMNPANGALLHNPVITFGEVRGAPAFDASGRAFLPSLDTRVYAINIATGAQVWSFPTDMWCETAPSCDANGRVYVHNKNGNLYCISPAGAQVWKINLGGESRGPMTIGPDDTLYVGFTGQNSAGLAVVRQLRPSIYSFTLSPKAAYGGRIETGSLLLDIKAPPTGSTIILHTSDATHAPVPPSVAIPARQRGASFTIQTQPVTTSTTITITADYGSSHKSATFTLAPPDLTAVRAPASVVGGNVGTGTVYLSGNTAANTSVLLKSSNTSALTVPAAVTVMQGHSSVTFAVHTFGVDAEQDVTITATRGSISKTALVKVLPATLQKFTLTAPSFSAQSSDSGVIVLTGAAGPAGIDASVHSSSAKIHVPAKVHFQQGQVKGTFSITSDALAQPATATITVTVKGVTQSQTVTANP